MNLHDARIEKEDWCKDYNEWSLSAIGNQLRISLMNGSTASPPINALNPRKSSSEWPSLLRER
jgi:hypothetical protein